MKWLDDSEEEIWRERCLVEVHTGMKEAGVLRGTYTSKNKGHWRKVWGSWEEIPCSWITTSQNQTHRDVRGEKVVSWPTSAPTNKFWWAQRYIVMSKSPKPPLDGECLANQSDWRVWLLIVLRRYIYGGQRQRFWVMPFHAIILR